MTANISGYTVGTGTRCGQQNALFVMALSHNSKRTAAPISTDSLWLGVAQMPRTREVAIFVLTDKQTDGRTKPIALQNVPRLRMHAG